MKREDLLDSLEYLDEELLREADQARSAAEPELREKSSPPRKKTISPVRWGTLAAGFIVLIVSFSVIAGVMRVQSGNMASSQKAENTEAAAAPDNNAEQPGIEGAEMQEMEAAEISTAPAAENAVTEDAAKEKTVNEAAETEDAAEEAAEEYAPAEVPALTEPPAETQAFAAAPAEPRAPEEAGAETPEEAKKSDHIAAMPTAEEESVKIRITSDAGEVIFALNDTPAAKSLVTQLPLRADSELYGSSEIVFHPEKPLDTENGTEGGGTAGYLGYFEPWNNIVMYYGDFDEYPGLYILGEAVSGAACIKDIRGRITVELITQEGGSNG